LEQQAKERLTGGVILVVLLVLLVPELLTGPRTAPSLAPAQPDQAPMRSYTMDLGDSAHTNVAPVAPSTTAPPARDTPAPVSSAPLTVATPAVTTPTDSGPAPVPPATTPAAATTAAPAGHPAGLAPRVRASSATPLWTVQLGTFSNRDNAARLVAGLKSHGFTGSIAEATHAGHKLFRVRVGAERDRMAAQKLLGRLKAAGEKGGEVVPR
jgi:cell division septation protein DedD